MVVKTSRDLGIQVLTLYAFSTENWRRPKKEIKALMSLLKSFIRSEIGELHKKNVRVQAIGDIGQLPQDVLDLVEDGMALTRSNTGMVLNVALSYSGRDDLVRAVRRIALKVKAGDLAPESISEETLAGHLDTGAQPDPDLLIRTSGELRVSNFLLWQIAYTEIFVTDVLWPDFSREHFMNALADYQRRRRRFGKTDEQINAG